MKHSISQVIENGKEVKYSGDLQSFFHLSSSNVLLVNFVTDRFGHRVGFQAVYFSGKVYMDY